MGSIAKVIGLDIAKAVFFAVGVGERGKQVFRKKLARAEVLAFFRNRSSGGKEVMLGITKRGDSYLRTLLVHGARAALRTAGEKPDRMLRWAVKLAQRRGTKIAVVALANKMARIIWALLAHKRDYSASHGVLCAT